MLSEIDDSGFSSFIKEHKLAVIDFYADWCGPCQLMKPVLEQVSSELKGKAAFAKINIDKSGGKAAEYGIMSIPTILVFSSGKLVDRLVGSLPKEMLKQRLEKFI